MSTPSSDLDRTDLPRLDSLPPEVVEANPQWSAKFPWAFSVVGLYKFLGPPEVLVYRRTDMEG